jgi:hypothetical protein
MVLTLGSTLPHASHGHLHYPVVVLDELNWAVHRDISRGGERDSPILIVDTRTGQVTIKTITSAETPVGKPTAKLLTVVPWSD